MLRQVDRFVQGHMANCDGISKQTRDFHATPHTLNPRLLESASLRQQATTRRAGKLPQEDSKTQG